MPKMYAIFSNFWKPHEAHHLAYASVIPGKIIVSARIFDLYAAGVVVSEEPSRYFQSQDGTAKLKFIAIDAVSKETVHTTFAEERHRLALKMAKRSTFLAGGHPREFFAFTLIKPRLAASLSSLW